MSDITEFEPSALIETDELLTIEQLDSTPGAGLSPSEIIFSTLTSRSQYLGREHFNAFAALRIPQYPPQIVGKAFHRCISPSTTPAFTWEQGPITTRPVDLAQLRPRPGIIVARRSEVGLKPYIAELPYGLGRICVSYAIEAGSLIDLIPAYDFRRRNPEKFLRELALQLDHQIQGSI